MSDPRVFFAAERTLLAWVRTGVTVIALGFVVARFGLFLTLLTASAPSSRRSVYSHWHSNALGIALVILGSALLFAALRNHQVYIRSLPHEDVPVLPLPWLTTVLAASVAVIGILLAMYLALV